MKKAFIVLFIITAFFIYAGGEDEIEDEPLKLVWSATCPPESVYTIAMKVFKNYIESNGDITVELNTSGKTANNIPETEACIKGLVDITYFDVSYFTEKLSYLEMISSAFIFKNYRHMKEVMNGETGFGIYDEIAGIYGVRPLGAFYLGSSQLNLVESAGEVRVPDDMKYVRVSCEDNDLSIARIKALGGIPVTYIDFRDIYSSILNRYSDAQDNEILLYKSCRFYDITKYIVLTNHVIKTVWPVINEERWQSLSDADQKLIMEAVSASESVTSEYILTKEKEAVEYYESIGFTIIHDPDFNEFFRYAQNMYKNDPVSSEWDMDLYDKIISLR